DPGSRVWAACIPAGRPWGELCADVQVARLQPWPVGVAGELCRGGGGVALGYHQRPALAAERFVPDPFVAGARLYRGGDLARLRDDGVVEYLGRNDQQVKIRGFRIELGEIEACLVEQDRVREALVVDCDGPVGRALS
ncbi:AMP-binding protein, partial [Pseudomonas kulmbachensis]|uniref:AMP-binding protein n=1 Tax=Pseudomonas kulmbachensis TaxID=3043408 RepID=UPI002AB1F4B0